MGNGERRGTVNILGEATLCNLRQWIECSAVA